MNFKALIVPGVAGVAAVAWTAPAMADGHDVEDRIASMEQRVKYLEERVASQDQMIVEKDAMLSGMSDGWFNSVAVGGAIELELVSESPAGEDSTTSAGVAKAELAIAAAIDDEVSGEIVVKHDDGTIVIDAVTVTFEPADTGLAVTGGEQGLPFGVFDTNLVSDPLTKDLGDTGAVSLLIGGGVDLMSWSAFALNSADDEFGENYGVALGLAMEGKDAEFGLDVSWINDIANDGNPGGIAASARASVGAFSALAELVTALDSGNSEAEPSAWMVETAFGFALGDRDATAAVGFQGSEDVEGLAETRMLVGISVDVWDNVGVGVEWKQEEFAGQDGSNDTIAVLLAAEF